MDSDKALKILLNPKTILFVFVVGAVLAFGGLVPGWMWLIIAALGAIYIVVPSDAIPEVLGPIGLVDDAIVGMIVILALFFAGVQPFAGSMMYVLGIALIGSAMVLLIVAEYKGVIK